MTAIPLSDRDIERRYLGALMYEPSAIVTAPVPVTDLAWAVNRYVLGAILTLHARGDDVNTTTLRVELDRAGRLRQVGDEYLLAITETIEPHPQPLANRVRELARLRRLRETGMQLAVAAEKQDIETARALLETAGDTLTDREHLRYGTIADAGKAWLRQVGTEEQESAIRTGFAAIDRVIGSLRPRSMTVIGGRSSCRKSWLSLAIALNNARRGHRVGIVSLEDEDTVWGERAALSEAGHPGVPAIHAVPDLARLPIELAYAIDEAPDAVLEAAGRLVLERGVELLVIDYVQAADFGEGERYDKRVAGLAKRAKRLAARAGIPLIVTSQLTTDRDRAWKEPTGHDLRESRDLLSAAEIVFLLWKESAGRDAMVQARLSKLKWRGAGHRFSLDVGPGGHVSGASETGEPRNGRQHSDDWRDS